MSSQCYLSVNEFLKETHKAYQMLIMPVAAETIHCNAACELVCLISLGQITCVNLGRWVYNVGRYKYEWAMPFIFSGLIRVFQMLAVQSACLASCLAVWFFASAAILMHFLELRMFYGCSFQFRQ